MIQKINIIVSVVIAICSLYLLFQHYNNKASILDKALKRWEYMFMKLGLIIMSLGSLWNSFKISNTPTSEVVLNVGLSMYMIWICLHFDRVFIRKTYNKTDTIDPKGQDYPDSQ